MCFFPSLSHLSDLLRAISHLQKWPTSYLWLISLVDIRTDRWLYILLNLALLAPRFFRLCIILYNVGLFSTAASNIQPGTHRCECFCTAVVPISHHFVMSLSTTDNLPRYNKQTVFFCITACTHWMHTEELATYRTCGFVESHTLPMR